jgi:2-polyprenyl-3-methyl-5-hydroxy-6-metoxy-1,4-benzoquinol methylase
MATATKTQEQRNRDEIEFFAHYYESHAYNPLGWRLRLERELKSLLKRNGTTRLGRVLSLGCGDGQFEQMLAPYADHVFGLDLSPEAIDIARRNARRGNLQNLEFECLPLEELEWSKSYDTIVCLATLHHVPPASVVQMLKTVHQHLVPGGLFYSQDPNCRGMLRTVGRVVMRGNYDKFHSPDERELDPRELARQLAEAGFVDVRIGHIDLTLIPGLYVFARGPSWLMRPMLWTDWLWCKSPLNRWSSGFNASARRAKN